VQAWADAQKLAPSTLRAYLGTLRQLFDYADVHPNPARSPRLELPYTAEREIVPPSNKQVLAMLDQMKRERRLLFAFVEQCGTRIGETLGWTWGDVDLHERRILSRPDVVKGRRGKRRARWVQVPGFLLKLLEESTPFDERDRERHLFSWPQGSAEPGQLVTKTMERACKAASIPVFSPHDLRHRRISLWHHQGIPAWEIWSRVGQTQVSTTLDTYTHTMPLAEVSADDYKALLVWSRCGPEE
jgi:integrase